MFQLTAWSLPSLAAIAIALHAAARVRRGGDVPGARAVGVLCACVVLWSLGQLLASLTTNLELKILASKLQYPGITLLPVAWLAFAVGYVRRRRMLGRRTLLALCAVPAATVTLTWTNELHRLVWTEVRLDAVAGYVGMRLAHGAWWPVHISYSYALVGAGTVILAFELSASRRHRPALAAVVAGPAVVAGLNVVYLQGWSPFPFIDPTPLGFAMGGLLLARGVLHSGLLGLSPSLHRQVVEQIPDAVLVVDGAGHVVDANPAAEQMLEDRATALTGAPVARLLPEAPIEELADDRQQSAEITLNGRAYHLRSSVLEPGENEARQTVVIFRDITERLETENELRQVHQELERLAHTDPLTGLHNRRYFMQRLHQEVERVRRSGHALSVLLLDLDRFKSINDTHGHAIGDRVLQRVAEVLADGGRASDVAARLGGEEFALLLPETPIDGALRLAERLRRVVAEQLVRDGHREPVAVTTSVGVATLSPAAPGADELLRQADMALYQAKRGGRNAVGCA